MNPEEADLQNDYRYRSYAGVIEKALRNFESSSEWADLISSLGKLNKVPKCLDNTNQFTYRLSNLGYSFRLSFAFVEKLWHCMKSQIFIPVDAW